MCLQANPFHSRKAMAMIDNIGAYHLGAKYDRIGSYEHATSKPRQSSDPRQKLLFVSLAVWRRSLNSAGVQVLDKMLTVAGATAGRFMLAVATWPRPPA